MNELKDKVAIVTGGGYGIGREIALAYGRAGAKVVVAARTEKPLKETVDALNQLGATSTFVRTDVSKEADCAGMAELTLKAFGRIDILVNNAGIAGPTKRIPDMSLAEWQETIDINLTGAWLAARAVLPTMDKQRSGHILNISSGAGRRGYPMRSLGGSGVWELFIHGVDPDARYKYELITADERRLAASTSRSANSSSVARTAAQLRGLALHVSEPSP